MFSIVLFSSLHNASFADGNANYDVDFVDCGTDLYCESSGESSRLIPKPFKRSSRTAGNRLNDFVTFCQDIHTRPVWHDSAIVMALYRVPIPTVL